MTVPCAALQGIVLCCVVVGKVRSRLDACYGDNKISGGSDGSVV